MDEMNLHCCCCEEDNNENCIICGKPLRYFKEQQTRVCAICHREKPANAECEDGHFVCDACHSGGGAEILAFLLQSKERDSIRLYLDICAMKRVHLHGPEHHSIVPCVLVTAYHNCGGRIDFEECLQEAWKRGQKVPGGACGFLGVCGAAEGTGIFVSLLCDATPLTADVWDLPQRMTMESLRRMTEIGGPRCCKRTGRIAIAAAADFVRERWGVEMPVSTPKCTYSERNRECIRTRCPYFNGSE